MSVSETIPNAGSWSNPYRFDGRDGVQADPATGLDWMATRAYDPTTGRFLSRDPLGWAPLYFADNPYVYAGNDPVSNIDPSGQYRAAGFGSTQRESGQATNQQMARVVTQAGAPTSAGANSCGGCQAESAASGPTPAQILAARNDAHLAANAFSGIVVWSGLLAAIFAGLTTFTGIAAAVCAGSSTADGPLGLGCAFLWSRAALAAATLTVLTGLLSAGAYAISYLFSNISDPLIDPASWFAKPTNLDTVELQMTAVAAGVGIVAAAIIAILSVAGADGLSLVPVGLIGGIGIMAVLGITVHEWMARIRGDLGEA